MDKGTLIIALLSSGVLSTLITGIFQLIQTKRSRKTGLESKVDKLAERQEKILEAQKRLEMEILRVELKLVIKAYPEKEEDILRLGECYFSQGGNWVMGSVFRQWLSERGITIPKWFHE